ncbi:MAG: EamA family transporter, partial [Pseudomonadota bacterium]
MSLTARISHASPRLKGNAAACAAMILWATGFPAAAIILQAWHPLVLTPVRLALAAITLMGVLVLSGGFATVRRMDARGRWDILWIGGALLSVSTVLLVYGQALVHPVTAAVIISMLPLVSALMGLAAGTERISLSLAIGIVLSIVGGVIVSAGTGFLSALSGDSVGVPNRQAMLGVGLLIAAITLFVAYSRACDQRLGDLSGAAKAGLTMASATPVVLVVTITALVLEVVPRELDLSPRIMAVVFWLGMVAIAGSMSLWFTAIRLTSVTVTAMHHNLVPFYVIVLSLAGGGVIALHHWLGAAMVIVGAVIAQLGVMSGARAEATGAGVPSAVAHVPETPRRAPPSMVPRHAALATAHAAPPARRRDVETGMIIMACAMLYLPLIDTFAKLASDTIAAGQISWARFFFQTLFLAPLALWRWRSWQPGNLHIHAARGCLIALATLMFFAALKYLPLADAISIFFIEPLILTVLSAIFLKEKIGWRRSLAVVCGFAGALIVIRPSYDVFGVYALLPLGTAATFATYLLLTRGVAQREDPVTIQFLAGVFGLAVMTIALAVGWSFEIEVITPRWPDLYSAAMLLGVGVVATTGHLLVVHAFRRAEAGILAPFQYLEIVPSVILGLVIFG